MCSGTMARDDAELRVRGGVAERAELRLTAEAPRDARRVDDVVAVRRARASLQRRGEIGAKRPELAQVGNDDTSRARRKPSRERTMNVAAGLVMPGRKRSHVEWQTTWEKPASHGFARSVTSGEDDVMVVKRTAGNAEVATHVYEDEVRGPSTVTRTGLDDARGCASPGASTTSPRAPKRRVRKRFERDRLSPWR